MTWEALTALGTLLSAAVIAATVIFAARQVRLTSRQLDHLRRSTQLEGMMQLMAEIDSTVNRESQLFISQELHEKMRDPEFRAGVPLAGRADLTVHKELHLLRYFERVGAYVKYGLIDGDIIYDLISPRILGVWTAASQVIGIQQQSISPQMWENYAWLVEQTKRWNREHGVGTEFTMKAPAQRVTGEDTAP